MTVVSLKKKFMADDPKNNYTFSQFTSDVVTCSSKTFSFLVFRHKMAQTATVVVALSAVIISYKAEDFVDHRRCPNMQICFRST